MVLDSLDQVGESTDALLILEALEPVKGRDVVTDVGHPVAELVAPCRGGLRPRAPLTPGEASIPFCILQHEQTDVRA